MDVKLNKGKNSTYELEISFSTADQEREKEHVLKEYQKDTDIAGFRKGQVPLSMVEKNIKPEYLKMSIVEHIVNHGIQQVLKENADIKFIGEPHSFSQDEKGETTTIKLLIDVYPEVEIKGEWRKKETIKPITVKVTEQEVEEALAHLKKNYADYQDTELLELGTISKVAMEFLDKEGNSIEKGTTYIGEPEFAESDFWIKTFGNKKKGEEFELPYKEKDFPAVIHAKAENKPAKVKFTIKDIKKQILPEFTEETIIKLFGKESEVKTPSQLREYIEKNISTQKYHNELVMKVEEFVSNIRKESMSVAIPKTMVDQEFQSRIQSLEKRFGSKEKVEEYLKSMTEEQAKQFVEDIQKASAESLEKFFILNKVTELLNIDLDWEKDAQDLAVEKKIYAHFNPSSDISSPDRLDLDLSDGSTSEGGEGVAKKTPTKKWSKAKA